MKKRFLLLALLLELLPAAGWALGPHEILLLINTNSAESVLVGDLYARLRKVPQSNVVRLDAPVGASLSLDAFRSKIWEPALAESKRRGVDSHILAWVYAPGFPWRVGGLPTLSLTGMTFLRGVPVDTNLVTPGRWVSPYYAGPNNPLERGYGTRSLDVLGEWMKDQKPMAAWMLAVVGENALSVDEAGTMLIRGIDSDSTRPRGSFYAVTNSDIRSRAREWEWAPTMAELRGRRVPMAVTNDFPRGKEMVMGIMAGVATFNASGIVFEAGAWADHLTSMGAMFENSGQTKCTEWLKAGATASGGTVTEPFSYWSKFPHARLFVHYAAGCTILESFYQSIRQPLEYLPIGDPLAAPWKPRGEVSIQGLEEALAEKGGLVRISVSGTGRALWSSYRILIDGLDVGGGVLEEPYRFSPDRLAPGEHEFRVVVRTGGLLRHQAFAVRRFSSAWGVSP